MAVGGQVDRAQPSEHHPHERPDLQPQPRRHRQQHLGSGPLVEGEVEGMVGGHVAVDVAGGDRCIQVLVDRLQRRNHAPVGQGRPARGKLRLDPIAGQGQLLQSGFGERRHGQPLVGRIDLQRPLGHQPADRVAHRHGADAQLRRQGPQRHALARRDPPADQGVADGEIDLVMDGVDFTKDTPGRG